MKDISLPDPETFTLEEIAKRWKCSLSRVEGYINDGKLKQGIDTLKKRCKSLRQFRYYKYNASDELLLNPTDDYGEPLSKVVGSIRQINFIDDCPKFLYFPIELEEYQGDIYDRFRNLIDDNYDGDVENFRKEIGYIDDGIPFPFFYDLDGTKLIPVENDKPHKCRTPFVSKRCPLIVPCEEVERFERKYDIRQIDDKTHSSKGKEKTTKKENEDIDHLSSQETDDVLTSIPLPPTDSLLKLPEVMKRAGYSKAHIYKMIDEGKFPKQKHPSGSSSRWLESDISAWVRGEWKNT